MVDLSHWDFAERFTGREAAALILGSDPSKSEEQKTRVKVVVDRMMLHYQNAFDIRVWDLPGGTLENQVGKGTSNHLILFISADMEELHQVFSIQDADALRVEFEWRANPKRSSFESQNFTRSQIIDWLAAIDSKSQYPFAG